MNPYILYNLLHVSEVGHLLYLLHGKEDQSYRLQWSVQLLTVGVV